MASGDILVCPHGGMYAWCPACTMHPASLPGVTTQAGWRCACGRGFSPQVLQCLHCGPRAAVPAEDFTGGAGERSLYNLYDGDPGPLHDLCVPPSEGGLCDHDDEPQECRGGRHCSC